MTSMAKGLQILDFLAASSGPVTVRELAQGTGMSKSTAHRLACELRDWGALQMEPEGYGLGLRLFELGGIALRHNHLEEIARPIMEDLFESTHKLIQLGVLQGRDVIYLARVGRQGHQKVASPVAGRIPATCAAIGKAMLAHNPVALGSAINGGLTRLTRFSIVDRNVMRSELAKVQRTMIATDYEEARIGLWCAARFESCGSRRQECSDSRI
jgi:DNA-binding IclR family transcriptional regulator